MIERKLIFASDRIRELGEVLVPGRNEYEGLTNSDGEMYRLAVKIIRVATRTEYLEAVSDYPAEEYFFPYYYEVQTD